jgi:hypothetical protein
VPIIAPRRPFVTARATGRVIDVTPRLPKGSAVP